MSESILASARRLPPPDDMTAVEQLLAYEQIRQLAARYALAVNMRDLDALVELFVEDIQTSRARRGREALREIFDERLADAEVDILLIGTHVINLVGRDHATGTLYCYCELGDPGRWVRQAIAYEDRYERRDGQWYFASRNHQLFYGLETDERPLAQAPANWPDSATGRGTVPYHWPTWRAHTRTVTEDGR